MTRQEITAGLMMVGGGLLCAAFLWALLHVTVLIAFWMQ